MKVLEKGQFRYTFACEECNAILMAEEKDFSSRDGYARNETLVGGVKEIICECSECSTTHVADSSKIPADVRNRILNKTQTQPRPFVPDLRYK